MKYIYCKIEMGTLYQNIMLVDTEAPSMTLLDKVRLENLGEELAYNCYQENEYHVKLDGNPDFYKAIIKTTNNYDKEHQIIFL